MMPDASFVPWVRLFFSSCFFIYSLIIYLLFRFYPCFETRVGLWQRLGVAATKTGTNDASGIVCAPRYVLFSLCFFDILTNDLILAQGGLMTIVGAAAMKTAQMMYLAGIAGVQT
jgi:hypothetical protein